MNSFHENKDYTLCNRATRRSLWANNGLCETVFEMFEHKDGDFVIEHVMFKLTSGGPEVIDTYQSEKMKPEQAQMLWDCYTA